MSSETSGARTAVVGGLTVVAGLCGMAVLVLIGWLLVRVVQLARDLMALDEREAQFDAANEARGDRRWAIYAAIAGSLVVVVFGLAELVFHLT